MISWSCVGFEQSFVYLQEMERSENILVICHQAVMRCVLAYYLDENSGKFLLLFLLSGGKSYRLGGRVA